MNAPPSTNPAAIQLVGPAIGLGRWTAEAGHPVDVVLFSGRMQWGKRTFEHPCFYFQPRPLPYLDDEALVRAFRNGTLAAEFPKEGGGAVPQVGWRVAFDTARAPGGWLHPEQAWVDTLHATTLAGHDVDQPGGPAAVPTSSFTSRSERARLRRWAKGAPGPGEVAGGAGFGVLARALYAVPRTYDAEVFAGRPLPPVPTEAPALGGVVHGLARDAPWLLATEGLSGLLPRVLGIECSQLRWPELMAVLGAAPPAHWHLHPPKKERGRRVVAAYRQLVALGYPPLDVAAAIAGTTARPTWADSGAHKQKVEWENRLKRQGGWTSVVPILEDALWPGADPTDTTPLWEWFQEHGARALTLLLPNRVAGGRLRLGGPTEDGRRQPSLNTLRQPNLWSVRPHEEPGCPWIGSWLDYVGGDEHRPTVPGIGPESARTAGAKAAKRKSRPKAPDNGRPSRSGRG